MELQVRYGRKYIVISRSFAVKVTEMCVVKVPNPSLSVTTSVFTSVMTLAKCSSLVFV